MTEGTPLTPEQFRQLNRDLMEKVLDRAASDPEWKQRLLDDPEAAMEEAGFPEAQRLQQMHASLTQEAEVVGHGASYTFEYLCDIFSINQGKVPFCKCTMGN